MHHPGPIDSPRRSRPGSRASASGPNVGSAGWTPPAGRLGGRLTVSEAVVTSRDGDPRYLRPALTALADLRTVTGLDALDLAVLLIDGVHVSDYCVVVALGIDTTGVKHPLGLWEGSTENTTVLSGPADQLAAARAPHRPESARHLGRRAGVTHRGDPDLRARGAGATLSGPHVAQRARASPQSAAAVGPGDPHPGLYQC